MKITTTTTTNQACFGCLLECGGPWPWVIDFHAPTKTLEIALVAWHIQTLPTRFNL